MVTRTDRPRDFETDGYLGSGLPVHVLAEDLFGTYILPFPCECPDAECRNGTIGEAIQASIIGLREFWTRKRDRKSPVQNPSERS